MSQLAQLAGTRSHLAGRYAQSLRDFIPALAWVELDERFIHLCGEDPPVWACTVPTRSRPAWQLPAFAQQAHLASNGRAGLTEQCRDLLIAVPVPVEFGNAREPIRRPLGGSPGLEDSLLGAREVSTDLVRGDEPPRVKNLYATVHAGERNHEGLRDETEEHAFAVEHDEPLIHPGCPVDVFGHHHLPDVCQCCPKRSFTNLSVMSIRPRKGSLTAVNVSTDSYS